MILCSDPKAQYLSQRGPIDGAIQRVLRQGHYILGNECQNFEKEFCAHTGARYGVGTANGTEAIYMALKALGVGQGDEVITVSHTAVATVAAVVWSGAVPIFADIDPVSYCMDPSKVKSLITRRTKAIMPVHLYGQPADLAPLLSLAKKNGLFLIEDCSQAHGAVYRGKRVGSFGDAGCFSFYPTKNLGAFGDGGMVVTSSKKVYEKSVLLRQYGWDKHRLSATWGFNSRLDEIQAAVLRVKLKTLDAANGKRRHIAHTYGRALSDLPLSLPAERADSRSVFHQYVIRLEARDALRQYLNKNGIQALIHYPLPAHLQKAYRRYGAGRDLKRTEQAARRILSLPMHPELTEGQCRQVVRTVKSFFKAGR